MDKTLEVKEANVKKAHSEGCPDVKKTLENMFPELKKKEDGLDLSKFYLSIEEDNIKLRYDKKMNGDMNHVLRISRDGELIRMSNRREVPVKKDRQELIVIG